MMNRKQKQFVSIWICVTCEAANSASAELCLTCGKARRRRELLGLRR
jgi:ribosomal protein L40E